MSNARETLEATLVDLLAVLPGGGYTLAGLAFGEAVEATLRKDGASFIVWLRPVQGATECYRQTVRFKIGHDPDPPDRQGYALIEAWCARLADWERTLSDDAIAELFAPQPVSASRAAPIDSRLGLEWLAVRCGLKRACRKVIRPEERSWLLDAARADDLHVELTEANAFVAGFCEATRDDTTVLAHVGRTLRMAADAAQAERAMIDAYQGGSRVTAAQVRVLGAALGYPSCCVETFLPVRDLPNAEIRFLAMRRTSGQASFAANDLLGGEALVVHAPCRYDCPRTLADAAALFGELTRLDAAYAADLRRGLQGLIVLFRSGSALRLSVTAEALTSGYRLTAVMASDAGPAGETWRAALTGADGVRVLADAVSVLRHGEEIGRLPTPTDDVVVRLFV